MLCLFVQVSHFQLLKQLTDYEEVWYESYTTPTAHALIYYIQ